jgi:hypothetical protein
MKISPVEVLHVGCTMFTVGAAGVPGCAFTTAVVGAEMHPSLFFAVTL